MYLYFAIDKKPVATATTAAFIYLLSAIGVFAYISNYWYLIPVFFGSFIGTYVVVRFK